MPVRASPEMMPEVTRIESQFRKPGTSLKDDLKVYDDMQKDGRAKLKSFQTALTAAEKASVRPINTIGATAVRQGRQIWNVGSDVTQAFVIRSMTVDPKALTSEVTGTLKTFVGAQVIASDDRRFRFHWTYRGLRLALAGFAQVPTDKQMKEAK